MPTELPCTEHLFSYGTLQLPAVQQANFGRLLQGTPDHLPGWRQDMVEITDAHVLAQSSARFHPIVRPSGQCTDHVSGTVFCMTAQELAQADRYEVDDYRRVQVTLASGTRAWVYVAKDAVPTDPA